jgi:hypothetical protein
MKYVLFLAVFCCAILQAEEDKISEKVTQYGDLLHQKELLGKKKKELADAILTLMPNEVLETTDFKVTRKQNLSIHTTLEEARKFNATKMVEQVDKEKIKQLYLSGIPVEGVEKRFNLSLKPKK